MNCLFLFACIVGIIPFHLQAEDSSKYGSRCESLLKIIHSKPVKWDEFESGTKSLIKDFPSHANGYQDMMILIQHYEPSNPKKAAELANELIAESTPERYRQWAKGYLNRMEDSGKPVAIRFTAVDGREVDFARMKGKVVLLEFWSTSCGPCIEELPKIKAAYKKFHEQDFEVIGVSYDTDQKRLQRFIKNKEIPWPQYNDGKQFADNKLAQEFGVDGIPHLILIDKKGILRFDNVQVDGDFEKKISELLLE